MSSRSNYTLNELKVMAIIPRFTGTLSVLGSMTILYIILSDRKKNLRSLYNRIMVGMSTADIINSTAYAFSTLPVPMNTPNVYGAKGNQATCTAQGFFIQCGFAVSYYNGALMLYYLLTIRYGMKEEALRKKVEPFIHSAALLLSGVPAIVGLILGMFNSVGNVCWIADYPKGCSIDKEVECIRGEHYMIFQWAVSGWVVLFLLIWIPGCMAVVAWTVWNQDKKMQTKWSYGQQNNTNVTSLREMRPETLRRSRSRRIKSSKRTKEVATQAFCYAGGYILSLIFPMILRPLDNGSFPLMVASQFFYPLQGFFNFFIYIRRRALGIKQRNPEKSYLWVIAASIFSKLGSARQQPGSSESAWRPSLRKLSTLRTTLTRSTRSTLRTTLSRSTRSRKSCDEVLSNTPSKTNQNEALDTNIKNTLNVNVSPVISIDLDTTKEEWQKKQRQISLIGNTSGVLQQSNEGGSNTSGKPDSRLEKPWFVEECGDQVSNLNSSQLPQKDRQVQQSRIVKLENHPGIAIVDDLNDGELSIVFEENGKRRRRSTRDFDFPGVFLDELDIVNKSDETKN